MHVLHQGRAEYLLVYPPDIHGGPVIKRIVMGPNTSKGEVRQLYVESGVWKKSRLLEEDLVEVAEGRTDGEDAGCLITEVVIPGFEWEDHKWMTSADLESLFPKAADGRNKEIRRELEGHVRESIIP